MSKEEIEKKYYTDFSRVFDKNNIRGIALFYNEDTDTSYACRYYPEEEMGWLASHIAAIMSKDKKAFELFLFAWQLAFKEYPELKAKVELISTAGNKTVH